MPMNIRVRRVTAWRPTRLAHSVWPPTPSPGAIPAARQSRFRGIPRKGRPGPRSCLGWKFFVQRIAGAAQRADRLDVGRDRLELGAQRLDVRIDRAVEAVAGIVPDVFQQFVAREDAARPLNEQPQEPVFVAGELKEPT